MGFYDIWLRRSSTGKLRYFWGRRNGGPYNTVKEAAQAARKKNTEEGR